MGFGLERSGSPKSIEGPCDQPTVLVFPFSTVLRKR